MSGPQDGRPKAADDVKARFREALGRKQHLRHGKGAAPRDPAEAHPHTAPAKPQRTSRRKSG